MTRKTPMVKVLLVDDEKELVATLGERLRTRGMDCRTASNGEEALAEVRSDSPHVMVLDLKMPGMDGLEVLRKIRLTHPAVEVIMLTGHGSDREERLARELGVFHYLTKPQPFDLLLQAILAAVESKPGGPRSPHRENDDKDHRNGG